MRSVIALLLALVPFAAAQPSLTFLSELSPKPWVTGVNLSGYGCARLTFTSTIEAGTFAFLAINVTDLVRISATRAAAATCPVPRRTLLQLLDSAQ